MQITGEKAWQVYKPTVTLPDRSMPYRGERLDLETYGEYTLTPGDMLYFPRGYIHSASTGRFLSLHVTLGVDVYNWLDFVQEALFVARQNPELRRGLPTDMLLSDGGGDLETYAGAIEDMLHMFCRHSTPERVVSSLRRLVACSVLSPHERFSATQPRSSV
jgi:ribosomal protein L16 Arg81 hydroxylase